VICPVQSCPQKYTASPLPQITLTNPAIPSRLEGRWPSITNVGAGCGGRGSVGRVVVVAGRALACERKQRADDWRGCVRQSRVVLAPVASSRRRNVDPTGFWQSFNPPAMEAKGIRLQGEHGISRQTIAQGMPECSSCTCMLVCVFFALFAHEIAGAASTRHSLRPLLWANEFAKLGRPAARMRRRILLAGAHTLPVTLRRPQRGRLEGRRPPAGAAHPSRLASLAPQDDGAEQLATTPLLQVSSDCASDC
jgi:hypothetical protein